MPCHLISEAHEWINEIPTVPIYYLVKPEPREQAWQNQQGKKTLLSLTLVWLCEKTGGVEKVGAAMQRWNTTTLIVLLLIRLSGGELHGSFCRIKAPFGVDPCRRQCQIGSLAGVAHLSNDNAGVLRWAQWEWKSHVEQKDFDFQYEYKLWEHGLSLLQSLGVLS